MLYPNDNRTSEIGQKNAKKLFSRNLICISLPVSRSPPIRSVNEIVTHPPLTCAIVLYINAQPAYEIDSVK